MEKREVGQTGVLIDTLGLGGAPLGGNFVDLSDRQAAEVVKAAIEHGLSYYDTAPLYGFGRCERVMGDVLRGSDHVLSSKVGRLLKPGRVENQFDYGMVDPLPFHVVYDYSYDGIMKSYEDSLQRLGLDRIDILLVHDIGTMQHGIGNAVHFRDLVGSGYRALDELRRSGQIRAMGLGVNESEACLEALEIGDWDVFLLAGRYTLLEQTPLETLFPACDAAGTTVICGGPFNSGILAGRNTWNYGEAPADVVARVRAMDLVARAFSIPLGAAALQFPLGSDTVTSVIPGPRSVSELLQIVEWFNAPIPKAFWEALKSKSLIAENAPIPRRA